MKKLAAIMLSVVLIGATAVQTPVYAAPELVDTRVEVPVTSSETLAEDTLAGFGGAESNSIQESQVAMFSARAAAQEGTCGEKLTWKLTDGTLQISGTGVMTNYEVDDNDICSAPWYSFASAITKVVVDKGVTEIGTYAFYNLTNVTSVTISDTVTAIKGGAFFKCASLTEVTLPTSVKTLGNGVFSNCVSLKTFKADGLTKIGEYAFENVAFTSYEVPKSLTSIDSLAFYNTKIEAFSVASGNTAYTAKDGVLYADGGKTLVAYPNGNGATSVSIPTTVTKIDKGAFFNNDGLTSVSVPEGVESVEKLAFYSCDGLVAVTLPKSVTFVHPLAFPSATKVTCNNSELKNYGGTGYRYLQEVSISVKENYDLAYEVLKIVNEKRAEKGLNALVMNQSLMESAMERAGETALLFDHTRPDGTSCFTINDLMYAENIAINGIYDAEGNLIKNPDDKIMDAWMASEGHKANILNPTTTSVGIGCVEHNGYYYWVQCFGNTSDTADCAKPANKTLNHTVLLSLEKFGEASSKLSEIYDVKTGRYCFEPLLSVDNKKEENGKPAVASVYVINPGYSLISAKLNSAGIKWSSDNTAVATISSDGTLKSVSTGSATITAKMEHYQLSTEYVLGVCRIYGASRYETSFATANTLKKTMGVDKFEAVVIATGEKYADALSGSYLAHVNNAPILLVNAANETKVKDYIKANVKSGGKVYILGGSAAVSDNMTKGLDGYEVKRIYGKTRYETNLAILNEVKSDSDELLVCTGENYADSLSASATGRPILLVKGDTLTSDQISYMKKLSPDNIYIIGGSAAVTTKMEKALGTYGDTDRIGGSSRFETSIMVANVFFPAPSATVLAYSHNFPDGLCGGPLSAQLNAPLILTATNNEAVAAYYTNYMGICSGAVLGGSKLISDSAVKEIFDMNESDKIEEVKK